LVGIILVFALVIIGYVIIPARKTIKGHFLQIKENFKQSQQSNKNIESQQGVK
jgi:hypothetical protein